MTLSLSAPKRVKHWDIANREKILCDVLTKQRVWLDDSQIDFMMIMRAEPSIKGYVDVLIEELHEIRSNS